jgi:hypothetical protein
MALVAGRNRVPSPATGRTALRTFLGLVVMFLGMADPSRVSHRAYANIAILSDRQD